MMTMEKGSVGAESGDIRRSSGSLVAGAGPSGSREVSNQNQTASLSERRVMERIVEGTVGQDAIERVTKGFVRI